MPTIEIPNIEIMPDWTQLVIQIISLCLLFFAFKRFAWIPTKTFLSNRQAFLNAGFKEAENAQTEAIALKTHYEEQIAQAETEAEEIIEASRNKGKISYEEIMANARQEANDKLEKMNLAIKEDQLAAQEKIKTDLIEVAVTGAEVLIKKEIDPAVHEQLFADFIAKVGGDVELS